MHGLVDCKLLEASEGRQVGRTMVDQLRAGWSSLLSWLREVQAWGENGNGMVPCTHDDYH
jgi:hypothetical protein